MKSLWDEFEILPNRAGTGSNPFGTNVDFSLIVSSVRISIKESGKTWSQWKNPIIWSKDYDFLQFQPPQTWILFKNVSLFLDLNYGAFVEWDKMTMLRHTTFPWLFRGFVGFDPPPLNPWRFSSETGAYRRVERLRDAKNVRDAIPKCLYLISSRIHFPSLTFGTAMQTFPDSCRI
jgi:hypothetical protein